jgi:peptidoglycan L-alanyl-D-glutamate endopeptidase CwlK
MSVALFGEDVLFYQRLLKSSGYYDHLPPVAVTDLDGEWGSRTTAADERFTSDSEDLKAEIGSFDSRSERNIATMHIVAQRHARRFLLEASGGEFTCKIISGTRSYAEQDRLYAQGRTEPGSIVTNAKGGQSNHNFGVAWDIGLFDGSGGYLRGATLSELRAYEDIATIVDRTNLEWGGDWTSIVDRPHYQVNTGRDTLQVRARFEAGLRYV